MTCMKKVAEQNNIPSDNLVRHLRRLVDEIKDEPENTLWDVKYEITNKTPEAKKGT